MLRGIGMAGKRKTNLARRLCGLLACMLHKIPWKTVALTAVVALIVVAAVKRNFLGLGSLTNAPTTTA